MPNVDLSRIFCHHIDLYIYFLFILDIEAHTYPVRCNQITMTTSARQERAKKARP